MSSSCSRIATSLAALIVFAVPAHTYADEPRVVVRVYDVAKTRQAIRAAAIQTAAGIVEHAGIAVDWHDCTDVSTQPQCQDSRRTLNFIVRLMPTFVSAAGAPRLSLETGKDSHLPDAELGFAVVDQGTFVGAMATIFHDRVQTIARRAGVDRSELLGRALAHEVGHLLLNAAGHSRTGLMRAVWTDGELTQNRAEDWLFAAADRLRLQNMIGFSAP